MHELSIDTFPEEGRLWVSCVGEDEAPAFHRRGVQPLAPTHRRAASRRLRTRRSSKRANSPHTVLPNAMFVPQVQGTDAAHGLSHMRFLATHLQSRAACNCASGFAFSAPRAVFHSMCKPLMQSDCGRCRGACTPWLQGIGEGRSTWGGGWLAKHGGCVDYPRVHLITKVTPKNSLSISQIWSGRRDSNPRP